MADGPLPMACLFTPHVFPHHYPAAMPSAPRQPVYGTYPAEIDGKPAWVTVSLECWQNLDPRLSTWVHVRFAYPPGEDGLPTGGDQNGGQRGAGGLEVINQVEDVIVELLGAKLRAVHAGSMSHAGMRHVYFYAPANADRGVADALRLVAAQFPQHAPGAMSRADPQHEQFAEILEPDIGQFEFMKNRWVMEQLEAHGDKHDVPRVITHYAYFPTPAARGEFAARLVELEYELDADAEFVESRDGQKMAALRFTHTGPTDVFAMTMRTAELAAIAADLDGEYDGWETEPVTG
jgi:hypothetical protein